MLLYGQDVQLLKSGGRAAAILVMCPDNNCDAASP